MRASFALLGLLAARDAGDKTASKRYSHRLRDARLIPILDQFSRIREESDGFRIRSFQPLPLERALRSKGTINTNPALRVTRVDGTRSTRPALEPAVPCIESYLRCRGALDPRAPFDAMSDDRASQDLFRLGDLQRRCYGNNIMPARDHDREHVRRALIRDGWVITHDPLRLRWGVRDLYVDLGAERLPAAEKGQQKIAVEIKSFRGLSVIDDIEKAIGQFTVYHDVLESIDPNRVLYLAVSEAAYREAFEDPLGQLLLAKGRARLLVYSEDMEVICQWTPVPPTAR